MTLLFLSEVPELNQGESQELTAPKIQSDVPTHPNSCQKERIYLCDLLHYVSPIAFGTFINPQKLDVKTTLLMLNVGAGGLENFIIFYVVNKERIDLILHHDCFGQ